MKTELATANQLRTLRILQGIPKYELLHLAGEKGLCPKYYDTHCKRAAGLTVDFYRAEGLTSDAKWALNRYFV